MTNEALYQSKIIKGGALLTDTRSLLSQWNVSLSVDENIGTVRRMNTLGKTSRSRLNSVLRVIKNRYLYNADIAAMFSHFSTSSMHSDALNLLLFYYAAKNDQLLYDSSVVILNEMRQMGRLEIHTEDVIEYLSTWNSEGKMTSDWNDKTMRRVAHGLTSALRDFGLLEGAANKRLKTIHVPLSTFAMVAFELSHEVSGQRIVVHPDWSLFQLTQDDVEILFIEAHQNSLLQYQAAGSTVRIEFPENTRKAYVDVVIQRTSPTS